MRCPAKHLIVAALGIACLPLLGCGSPTVENSPAVYENNVLDEVGVMYELFTKDKHRAPKGPKDFEVFSDGSPTGVAAIKQGNVVVIWGVTINPERGNDSADEILAFVKEVPQSGGFVLMKDRTIKKMTPEEFQAAPKAGKIDEPKAKG